MDAMKVRRLAFHALSGFNDMERDDAIEAALWDLTEILLYVADDPASVALVRKIEGGIRAEGLVSQAQVPNSINPDGFPSVAL